MIRYIKCLTQKILYVNSCCTCKKYLQQLLRYTTLWIGIGISGCEYHVGEDLGVDISCPEEQISYTSQVVPILTAHCYTCHQTGVASGGVNLDSYENIMVYVEDSSLIGSIRHENPFISMPPGDQLEDCDIDQIAIWIQEGAVEN